MGVRPLKAAHGHRLPAWSGTRRMARLRTASRMRSGWFLVLPQSYPLRRTGRAEIIASRVGGSACHIFRTFPSRSTLRGSEFRSGR
jgi:hypothetical protein